jgi:hypothetical protein
LLTALKQASPILFIAAAIGTGAVIFGSDGFVSALGLSDLRNQFRAHLGIAFVFSTSMLVAQLLSRAVQFFRKKRRATRTLAGMHDTLRNLTPDERAYLLPFVVAQKNTINFPVEDGIAGGLVAKNILFRSSNIFRWRTGIAHNLQPWARDFLEAHPDVLEGANLDVWEH